MAFVFPLAGHKSIQSFSEKEKVLWRFQSPLSPKCTTIHLKHDSDQTNTSQLFKLLYLENLRCLAGLTVEFKATDNLSFWIVIELAKVEMLFLSSWHQVIKCFIFSSFLIWLKKTRNKEGILLILKRKKKSQVSKLWIKYFQQKPNTWNLIFSWD